MGVKSVTLCPYCPWPPTDGAKMGMLQHIRLLKELGDCTILSAARRPVGGGWSDEARRQLEQEGFKIKLRGEGLSLGWRPYAGLVYGALCKGLKLERAFGHSNPYHRFAFPSDWWKKQIAQADLVVIHYSYWGHLPASCPKVVILHDLHSNIMWGGANLETRDLSAADLVVCVSKDEELQINKRGVYNTLWIPPLLPEMSFSGSDSIGLVGSANQYNREGLCWLERAEVPSGLGVRLYGALSGCATREWMEKIGSYESSWDPYRECGVILLPTATGMGIQVKVVEALVSGRALVTRKGAMRGLPKDGGWIEVDTPEEMIDWAKKLSSDKDLREAWSQRSRDYCQQYLHPDKVRNEIKSAYLRLAKK